MPHIVAPYTYHRVFWDHFFLLRIVPILSRRTENDTRRIWKGIYLIFSPHLGHLRDISNVFKVLRNGFQNSHHGTVYRGSQWAANDRRHPSSERRWSLFPGCCSRGNIVHLTFTYGLMLSAARSDHPNRLHARGQNPPRDFPYFSRSDTSDQKSWVSFPGH